MLIAVEEAKKTSFNPASEAAAQLQQQTRVLQSHVMASGIIFRDAVCLTWWCYVYAWHNYQWIFWLYARYRQLLITSKGILIGRHYVFLINIQHSRLQISCVYLGKMGLSGSEGEKKSNPCRMCCLKIVYHMDLGQISFSFFLISQYFQGTKATGLVAVLCFSSATRVLMKVKGRRWSDLRKTFAF